jgi:hypothetical protein
LFLFLIIIYFVLFEDVNYCKCSSVSGLPELDINEGYRILLGAISAGNCTLVDHLLTNGIQTHVPKKKRVRETAMMGRRGGGAGGRRLGVVGEPGDGFMTFLQARMNGELPPFFGGVLGLFFNTSKCLISLAMFPGMFRIGGRDDDDHSNGDDDEDGDNGRIRLLRHAILDDEDDDDDDEDEFPHRHRFFHRHHHVLHDDFEDDDGDEDLDGIFPFGVSLILFFLFLSPFHFFFTSL